MRVSFGLAWEPLLVGGERNSGSKRSWRVPLQLAKQEPLDHIIIAVALSEKDQVQF